jgi:hypothetical protein
LFYIASFSAQIHVSNGTHIYVNEVTLVSNSTEPKEQSEGIIYINSATIINNQDSNSDYKIVELKKSNQKKSWESTAKKSIVSKNQTAKQQVIQKDIQQPIKQDINLSHLPDSSIFFLSAKNHLAVVTPSNNTLKLIAINAKFYNTINNFEIKSKHKAIYLTSLIIGSYTSINKSRPPPDFHLLTQHFS